METEPNRPSYIAPGEGSDKYACANCGEREYIKISGTGYICAFGCPVDVCPHTSPRTPSGDCPDCGEEFQ